MTETTSFDLSILIQAPWISGRETKEEQTSAFYEVFDKVFLAVGQDAYLKVGADDRFRVSLTLPAVSERVAIRHLLHELFHVLPAAVLLEITSAPATERD